MAALIPFFLPVILSASGAMPRASSNFVLQVWASAPPSAQLSTSSKPAEKKNTTAHKKRTAARKTPASTGRRRYTNARRRPLSPRVRRMRQAFVASASLRPMAQQVLQDRSLPAYAGVERYARLHAKDDVGALAWLVIGYAHVLDHDYAEAIDPLSRAKVHAGDLGDYVAYYLGTSYMQTGRTAEAIATLADFGKAHPDSVLEKDAIVSYADALLGEGQAQDAATALEQIRIPTRSDVEFTLGRAYAALGENAKAAAALETVYYTMPLAGEADGAHAALEKLPIVPAPKIKQRETRAELLMKHRRYADAADEYRELLNEVATRKSGHGGTGAGGCPASRRTQSRRQGSAHLASAAERGRSRAAAVSAGPGGLRGQR